MSKEPARWKCVCAYDGGAFQGWQSQAGGGTVQDVIEEGLRKLFRRFIRIHGSSRTDAGVHARGQVFHFDADWNHPPERLLAAFRTVLPAGILIRSVRRVPPGFHARLSARGKRYRYHIFLGRPDPFQAPYCWAIPRPLDVAAMERATLVLRGRRDFASFSAHGGRQMETTVRDLRRLDLRCRGRRLVITAEADGFLYKMVRSLAGGLVNVGTGRLTPDDIVRILHSRERTALVETAPPQGLFLDLVLYSPPRT